MTIEMTLAEIAKCADDDVVGHTEVIVEGLAAVAGLHQVPVTALQFRRYLLSTVAEQMSTFLAAGGAAAALREACDRAIGGAEHGGR